MRRRASAASERSTVRDNLMRASDSLILIRLSSCLGVAVMVCKRHILLDVIMSQLCHASQQVQNLPYLNATIM